jgi:hypothetical protein
MLLCPFQRQTDSGGGEDWLVEWFVSWDESKWVLLIKRINAVDLFGKLRNGGTFEFLQDVIHTSGGAFDQFSRIEFEAADQEAVALHFLRTTHGKIDALVGSTPETRPLSVEVPTVLSSLFRMSMGIRIGMLR